MNGTLKHCPFCGGNRQTIKSVWKTWRFVACECKAAGAPAKTDELAMANWNNRSISAGVDADELYGLRCTIGRLENMIRSIWAAASSDPYHGGEVLRLAGAYMAEIGERAR